MNQTSNTPQPEPEITEDQIDKNQTDSSEKLSREKSIPSEEVLTIERLIPVTFKKEGHNYEVLEIKDHDLKQILITTDGEGLVHHMVPRSQFLETLLTNLRDLARKNHMLRHDNDAARDVSAGHRRSYERTMQDYETQGHMMDDPADTFLRSHAVTIILFISMFAMMCIFFYLYKDQTQDFINDLLNGGS